MSSTSPDKPGSPGARDFYGELLKMGIRTIAILGTITFLVWSALAIQTVSRMLSERKLFFSFVVESHQEEIVSAQWRPFMEALGRNSSLGLRNVRICWPTEVEGKCQQIVAQKSWLATPVVVDLGNAQVYADLSMQDAISYCIEIFLLSILTAFTWIHFIWRLKEKSSATQSKFALVVSQAIESGNSGKALAELPAEMRPLTEKLLTTLENLREVSNQKAAADTALDLAEGVGHDISSPLTTIEVVTELNPALSENDKSLLRIATVNIRNILNKLTRKAAANQNITLDPANIAQTEENLTNEPLFSLMEATVSEKRRQLSSKFNNKVDLTFDSNHYALCSLVQPIEFKRMLSNLINNAVEAISEYGKISVSLLEKDQRIYIEIKDTGKGIPPPVLQNIGGRGNTLGKATGSGIGLYHAKTTLNSWGGTLRVKSTSSIGTTIEMMLLKSPSPLWYASQLDYTPGSTFVILDSDPTNQEIWKTRLNAISDTKFIPLTDPLELKQWIQAQKKPTKDRYLIEHNLKGLDINGFELTQTLGIIKSTVLLTTQLDDLTIRELCGKTGLRLLPKNMAAFVAITPTTTQSPDAVLIDDSPITHLNWSIALEQKGKSLQIFESIEAFLQKSESIDKNTNIYVDSKLGNGVQGEDASLSIFEAGYENIYLTTGVSDKRTKSRPWLKGIQDKAPPFV